MEVEQKVEDVQNGRRQKWKTTKMEDDQNGREFYTFDLMGDWWWKVKQPGTIAIPSFGIFLDKFQN